VGGADKDGNPNVMNKLQPASILSVDFKVMGVTVSGLSVDSLAISNESYRPYKGVRSITKAGLFEVRT
jgi:AP-3 complex subunit mu